MKIDWTKPIRTVNGRKARYIGLIANIKYPRLCTVEVADDGPDWPDCFTEEGIGSHVDSDIENIPEERYVWINIYSDSVKIYKTFSDATYDGKGIIGRIKVKIEEGWFNVP